MKTKDKIRKIIRLVLLIALSIIILFPIFYIFSSSLFSQKDFNELRVFPQVPIWENYHKALSERHFTVYLINSIVTSLLEASMRAISAILAAFTFTHLHFKGKGLIFSILVLTIFIPSDALLYQNYMTIANLNLLDTHLGIILPSLFSCSQMLLLMGYFKALGKEYYEASSIDGASNIKYMVYILVPISQPVVLTVFIQSLITSFNSYLWPLIVTNKPSSRTIQVALTMLGFAESGERGALMATIAIITLPSIIIIGLTKNKIEETLIKK